MYYVNFLPFFWILIELNDLQENIAKIYLPTLQFYLPWAAMQWDMSINIGNSIMEVWQW